MHRVVGEEREGAASGSLERDDGEGGIDGAGGADGVEAFVAGMHVGADVLLAEGIGEEFVGPTNPATIEGVFVVINDGPADFSGSEAGVGLNDRFGDFWNE